MYSSGEFWETMKILVEKDFRRNISDDVDNWVENVMKKWLTSCEEDGTDDSAATRKRQLSQSLSIDSELDEEVKEFLLVLEKKLHKTECRYRKYLF